jgi:hypothetical protein
VYLSRFLRFVVLVSFIETCVQVQARFRCRVLHQTSRALYLNLQKVCAALTVRHTPALQRLLRFLHG